VEVDQLVGRRQLAEGLDPGVQVPAGRRDVADSLSGKRQAAPDAGHATGVADPFELHHRFTPDFDGGRGLA
jgi:hypothetical protein